MKKSEFGVYREKKYFAQPKSLFFEAPEVRVGPKNGSPVFEEVEDGTLLPYCPYIIVVFVRPPS